MDRRCGTRGFTLVELACVTLILAIIIASGLSYLKTPLWRSRTIEMRYAMGAIAALEYQRRIETGAWLACPAWPPDVPAGTAVPWRPPEGAWRTLRFDAGDTRFQYAVAVGVEETPTGREDYFVVTAHGDLDGDGVLSRYTLDSRRPREIVAENGDE